MSERRENLGYRENGKRKLLGGMEKGHCFHGMITVRGNSEATGEIVS